jgi:hypothetical protein
MHCISRYRVAVAAIAVLFGTLFGAEIDEATRRQYEELVKRQHVGGRLKPEERQSMMKVFPQLHPPRESTGMVALTDLGKKMYQGEQGGLYPGGENSMPAAHMQAGLHPSDKGSAKIANLMMNFFKNDPTARIWFLT